VKELYYKSYAGGEVMGDNSLEGVKKSKKKNVNKDEQMKEKKTFIFRAPLPEDDDMKVFTEFDKRMFSKLSNCLGEMANP
jgi:hypothetical protein